jgi:RecA-family ATPase
MNATTAAGKTPGLPLISFASIMSEPLPPIEWDVEGLVARRERVLIYAEWGALKTWLGLDLGLHLAAGGKWLDQFNVPEARRVLYIDEEMNERTLRRRIKRLGAGMVPRHG